MDSGSGKAALRAAGAQLLLDLPRQAAAAARIPAPAANGLRHHPAIEFTEPDPLRPARRSLLRRQRVLLGHLQGQARQQDLQAA